MIIKKYKKKDIFSIVQTISTKRGSSGFGSAIKTLKEVKVVEIFKEGFHDPYKIKNFISFYFVGLFLICLLKKKKKKETMLPLAAF